MQPILNAVTGYYPLWLAGCAAVALVNPASFAWFNGPWITAALGTVMLGMGLTLTIADFRRLLSAPGALSLGFLAHYTIMPLSGWLIGRMLQLEPGMAVGLILVASCPSGTASNVVCYLAKVDVALAVSVTLTSTLFAFATTPLWCQVLAGHYVPVDALGLCLSTLKVVAVVLITAGIVAQNAEAVIANAGKLTLAALLLHVFGFVLGYIVARLLGYPVITARTIAIEVGMQNGGMAAMLAKKNFPTQPLAAVPAVFSGVMQNLIGSIVAAWWRRRPHAP
jgi:BASS family bile acid:Na+ symporter